MSDDPRSVLGEILGAWEWSERSELELYELERCEACGLFASGNVPEGLRWRVCICRRR